jgi:hypothetical protein
MCAVTFLWPDPVILTNMPQCVPSKDIDGHLWIIKRTEGLSTPLRSVEKHFPEEPDKSRTFAGAAPTALALSPIRGPSPSGLGSRLAGRPSGPKQQIGLEGGAPM